jgi:hypothetical protein
MGEECWREKCPSSHYLPSLPFSFGCHSLGWRLRRTLRVQPRPQVDHRHCCRWGHQRASPSIRDRTSTDIASGGMSCSIALCSVRTSCSISGCLSRTSAESANERRAPGRGKVLSLFPNGLVRRPNRTRHRGRIGIVFGRGLPRQTRELATSGNLDEPPAGSEGSSPFFVENVECRQADVEDFVFTKYNFVAHSSLASHRIKRRRC